MSSPELDRLNPTRLAEVIGLNRQAAALIRAGLPLEVGLGAHEIDSLSARIGGHLREGLDLSEALERESRTIPPSFRAVIETGLAAGNLPAALEGLARTAETLRVIRSRMAIAAIYPSLLIILAIIITLSVTSVFVRRILQQFVEFHRSPPPALATLAWLISENPWGWLYWSPILLLLLIWGLGGTRFFTLRLPGVGAAMRYYRLSLFADLVGMLLNNQVPLENALTLAADASGDRRLAREAHAMANDIRQGQPASEALDNLKTLPPFARWMISSGLARNALPGTLAHCSRWARRRGDMRARWFTTVAPGILTIVVGFAVLAAYTTIHIAPLITLLNYLVAPEID